MRAWKWLMVCLMACALCVSMSACMNNGDTPKVQATMETNYMPETGSADMGVNATQPPVAFDWVTGSGTVEAAVNRISEIEDSRVVVAGDTALVGVKFTSAYQGEMTDRIREMIASEVQKADPAIRTVAVTAETADVTSVYEISDQLRGGQAAETLAGKINEIVGKTTTLR